MPDLSIFAQAFQENRVAFFAVGYFGEILMVIISCILLYGKPLNLVVYLLGAIFNVFLNKAILKPLIKQPRPLKPVKFLNTEKITYASYGMPSGHSQFVFYSIAYLYLIDPKITPWFIIVLAIGILTIYERWVFRNHTLEQLIAGVLVGSAVAYGAHRVLYNLLRESSLLLSL